MRILMCGGGTAGHVFPALAVASELKAIDSSIDIHFVGSAGGLEETIVPDNGYTLTTLPIKGMPRKRPLALLAFAWSLLRSLMQAWRMLRTSRPDLVMGFGGFASAPLVLLAPWMRIPTVLHEQNSMPGVVTRRAAKRATAVAVSYPQTKRHLGQASHLVYTGNPVRPSVMKPIDMDSSRRHLALRPGVFTVLVFGGSRGAKKINDAVLSSWPELSQKGVQLLFITGEAEHHRVMDELSKIESQGVDASSTLNVYPFYKDIEELYHAADLVVSRAGASSIAELTALGKPALLIPYPYATDDHQQKNAEALEAVGAARIIADAETNGETLAGAILEMMDTPLIDQMSVASLDYGMPDSGTRLAELAIAAAGKGLTKF